MAEFYSRLSGESGQDASTTATYFRIILKFLLTKVMIAPLLTTMWDHRDGFPKKYCCAYAIYLLT